jgi:hypothetical protein
MPPTALKIRTIWLAEIDKLKLKMDCGIDGISNERLRQLPRISHWCIQLI